jgi:hypothetical protein
MYGPYFVKCHACGETYSWTAIELACTFCGSPHAPEPDRGCTVVRSLTAARMKMAIAAVILLLIVIFLSIAVYVAPKCQPGQSGARLGGMLIEGCR